MKKLLLTALVALFVFQLIGCGSLSNNTTTTECTHEYTSTVTKDPTYEKEGERTNICSKCGYTFIETIERLTKHIVPSAVLDRAVSNAKYYASPFSISVSELVRLGMSNYSMKHYTAEEAISKGYLTRNQIDSSIDIDYVYCSIISGDTMVNPDLPFLTEYEAEAVMVLMLFDENDNLLNSGVALCSNLRTYAILTMTS